MKKFKLSDFTSYSKIIVGYHKDCMDGLGSAYVAEARFSGYKHLGGHRNASGMTIELYNLPIILNSEFKVLPWHLHKEKEFIIILRNKVIQINKSQTSCSCWFQF